jgi:hemerythrin
METGVFVMTDTVFEWNESFLIGIEELDHEHKVLIDDINTLHKELGSRNQKSEIEKCLGEICARMQAHFALEEHVMKEHDYAFFDEHKREHDDLLDNCTEYMLRYINDASASPNTSIEDSLKHWVLKHIVTSDKKMSLMVQDTDSFKKALGKRS